LAHNRLRVGLAALMLGAAAFALAGCGRAGAPEVPPGGPGLGWGFGLPSASAAQPAGSAPNATPPNASASPPPPGETALSQVAPGAPAQTTTAKNGFDTGGNPVAPPGLKKPFLLDPILQ
jgi:hypothetical protein